MGLRRNALVLTLRLLAIFGAATTLLTLLRLTTGIAMPLLPLAFVAPFVALQRGEFGSTDHGVACATLGVVAGAVHLVESCTAPGTLDAHGLTWVLLGSVLTGFVVGGLARFGATVAQGRSPRTAAGRTAAPTH